MSSRIYGLTLDMGYVLKTGTDGNPGLKKLNQALPEIIQSLKGLPKWPTIRIVFDFQVPAAQYAPAINALKPYADNHGSCRYNCVIRPLG